MKIVLSSKSWLVLSKYQFSASNSAYKIPKTQQRKKLRKTKDIATHLRSGNDIWTWFGQNFPKFPKPIYGKKWAGVTKEEQVKSLFKNPEILSGGPGNPGIFRKIKH